LKEKLIKIGAKVVTHGRYVAFQMAEVAIPRQMFQEILRLIAIDRCKVVRQQFAALVAARRDALAKEFGQRIAEMMLRLKRSCALNQSTTTA
jgi:hypothetical protein